MAGLMRSIARAARRLVQVIAALVPARPIDEAPAPDVDGRAEAADATAIELDILRKDGHGGYR